MFGEGNADDVSDAYAGPTPCANTMRNGLREVYVRLKTHTRAYEVGVLLSKCPRGVRFVLKLARAYLRATCQVEPTRCLCEELPSRLCKSGYQRLRACRNKPTRGLICPLSFCPLTAVENSAHLWIELSLLSKYPGCDSGSECFVSWARLGGRRLAILGAVGQRNVLLLEALSR